MPTIAQNTRHPDHPIDDLFYKRWSPRSFTEAALTEADVLTLIEAARWSPSASNVQPWRFVYGLRGDAAFDRLADALGAGNRAWAHKAAALILIGSYKFRTTSAGDLVEHGTHAFDAGAAWAHLALQAHLKGLVAHAMGGFDHAKARLAAGVAESIDLFCVVAVISRQNWPCATTTPSFAMP